MSTFESAVCNVNDYGITNKNFILKKSSAFILRGIFLVFF